MAATELDEDAWLYGDTANIKTKDNGAVKTESSERTNSPLLDDLDDVIVNSSRNQQPTNKIVSTTNILQPKATTPSEEMKGLDDDDGVFEQDRENGEEGRAEGGTEDLGEREDGEEAVQGSQETEGGEEEEEDEESESDEDVQIHIGPIETSAPFYQGRLPSTSNTPLTGQKKVDVEAVPTIGKQNLYEIDLDSAEKPWRLPGADITDYFNYGFTEETWRLYCDKQRKMKAEVIHLNKIAVHTTRIVTLPKSATITSHATIPSIEMPTLPPPPPLPFHPGLLPPTMLPPPHLPSLHNVLPPTLSEPPPIQDTPSQPSQDQSDDGKTPEPMMKEEASDGRTTPGVDQDGGETIPPQEKLPLLPPPSLPPPIFSGPPIRTSNSSGPDAANAMAAAMLSFRPHEAPFPNFPLPPPGFPPPFPPQLAGGDFRPRMPPFPGGPPPFPLLPGGPLDVPGMLPPHLEDRGLPIHDLGLPAGWDPSMGPPPPELFEMMARRDGMDFPRGSRSPSRSGSSGRSRSRSRSSSYDDRNKGRRREKRVRRHSRSRSHSHDRDRDRDRHARSSRRHRTNHHRTERHDRDRERERDRDREREREREREKERERDRRRREDRSRRDRSRRHRSSSRDREEDRASGSGATSRAGRERKTKEPTAREERSHSQTPT